MYDILRWFLFVSFLFFWTNFTLFGSVYCPFYFKRIFVQYKVWCLLALLTENQSMLYILLNLCFLADLMSLTNAIFKILLILHFFLCFLCLLVSADSKNFLWLLPSHLLIPLPSVFPCYMLQTGYIPLFSYSKFQWFSLCCLFIRTFYFLSFDINLQQLTKNQ